MGFNSGFKGLNTNTQNKAIISILGRIMVESIVFE